MKYVACFLTLMLAFGRIEANAQVVVDQAATAGESYARGASDMIRASGERNLSNSQAAINMQDAYSAAIDNSVKSTEAFWERQDIYKQHREQDFYKMDQRRQRYLEEARVKPLTADEFDRSTGAVAWPKVLTQPQYDEFRVTLDDLFHARAETGYLTSDEYLLAQQTNKAFRAKLDEQRDDYPRQILSQMTRFLLKLNREMNENLG